MGFDYAGGTVFELPIVALLNEDSSVCAKIFADINSKQVKVGAILLQAIKMQIGDLSKNEETAAKLVVRLGHSNDSPLRDRIKFPESLGNPSISSDTLRKVLQPLVAADGALYEVTTENERYQILVAYFKAWQAIFPQAWGSDKHVLLKNIGLYTMARLTKRVFENCDRYHGGARTVDAFKDVLGPISLVSWEGAKLDGPWGNYSSQGGIDRIVAAIFDVIRQDRKNPPSYERLSDLAGDEDVEPEKRSE